MQKSLSTFRQNIPENVENVLKYAKNVLRPVKNRFSRKTVFVFTFLVCTKTFLDMFLHLPACNLSIVYVSDKEPCSK